MFTFLLRPLFDQFGAWVGHTVLALNETFRIRGPLVVTVMIVCGITIPLALLCGLTAGLVGQQEEDFLKSPSAVELRISATGKSPPLTRDYEKRLEQHSSMKLVIPDITKVGDLKSTSSKGEVTGVTLLCTKPGDPALGFYGVDVLHENSLGIVLSTYLAEQLGVIFQKEGPRTCRVAGQQYVTLSLTRQEDHGSAEVDLEFEVCGVANLGLSAMVAYLHRHVMNAIEDYQQGQSVPQFGWPGFARSAPAEFDGYLAFSKAEYSPIDLLKLKANGLVLERVENAPERTLYGLLNDHSHCVYRLFAEGTDPSQAARVNRPAEQIEPITDADDIILPWTQPMEFAADVGPCQLVGLTFPRRWLKPCFRDAATPFVESDAELSARLPSDLSVPAMTNLKLHSPSGAPVTLAVMTPTTNVPTDPSVAPTATLASSLLSQSVRASLHQQVSSWLGMPAVTTMTLARPVLPPVNSVSPVIVPAVLLAHLHAVKRGEAMFDEQLGRFTTLRTENTYYQGRVIATDIHAVPIADAMLTELGFATQSQRTRVEELEGYSRTLRLLTYLVGGTTLLFGMWTLMAALWSDTSRKMRSLAQLRVMGVGRLAIFYIVMLRSLMIGLVAALVTLGASYGLADLLTRHLAACVIAPRDLATVLAIAIGASLLGAMLPAIRATMVDPGIVTTESHRY